MRSMHALLQKRAEAHALDGQPEFGELSEKMEREHGAAPQGKRRQRRTAPTWPSDSGDEPLALPPRPASAKAAAWRPALRPRDRKTRVEHSSSSSSPGRQQHCGQDEYRRDGHFGALKALALPSR